MIPIIKNGKPIGMVSSNFLVEFINNDITTKEFETIFGNCSTKLLDMKLSNLTNEIYVKKAQILEWHL